MENGTDRNGWMRVALDATRDAVVALDGEGRVTFMNRAAEDMAGVDEDNALGRPLASFLRPLDEDSHRLVELAPDKPLRRPLLLEDRQVEATLEPLEDNSGAVLVMRDVSARRHLEEELRRRAEELSGEDRRKDQFLAMLAHELRNPLAPIRNAVELMRQVENIDPAFQRSREMVERQVKHLARLVDDLLDISRITRGSIRLRKEVVTLADAVERVVEVNRPLLENRSHKLYVQLPPEPIRLEADPARLEQILSNLLDNAARYTMPGGRIWVSASQEEDEAVIRVRDTGIGVPPDVLERVFEPFMQSDDSLARTEGGLGVGLTLVRSLVEMHGGRVEAHSPGLGQGSEFVIRLPARVPADQAAPEAEPAVSAARPLKVLVVEDNVDAAESLASLLRLWSHDVSVVHDGRSALEAARVHHPEVVLLDIGLPGLDGYQVAQRLRDEVGLDHTLLVAMTGYGQPEDRRRSREAGIHHHFVKPVEPAVLRNLLAGVGVAA
ncbi:MAG TPA: ATP-binding protein [Thermoanaerobaculia bacterium]